MNDKDDILVEVKGVSKKFSRSLKQGMWYGLKDMGSALIGINGNRSTLREGEFWAVKDVSFSLRRGECLGLIGHNGAGKSTLLKMLNGLIRPDEGSITMRGKIGALIELGAGFNPLLTGRENVFINGQLLGFSRKEIEKKLDAILEFAEIGEFIDSPVQNYSSGMKVRLGFAVAAQMEPDVLLIDEVLAVGDVGFKVKCMNKISDLLKNCAVIFVSHSMPQIARICTLGILLENGKNNMQTSNIGNLIELYYSQFESEESSVIGSGKATVKDFNLENFTFKNKDVYTFNSDHLDINAKINVDAEIKRFGMHVFVVDAESRPIAIVSSLTENMIFENNRREFNMKIHMPTIFTNGKYTLNFTIVEIMADQRIGEVLISYRAIAKIIINKKTHPTATSIQIPAVWKVESFVK